MNERFWNKVEKSENCWEWVASKDKDGYGQFWDGKMVRCHRLSWEIHNGVVPEGLCVLHKCDNPACVRPDHLFLGTNQDNVDDRNQKGRQARGEKHGMFGRTGEKHPMFGRTGEKAPMFGRTGEKAPMFGKGHLIAGEKHPNVKISKQDVLDIRLLHKETNFSRKEIGIIFGISYPQVNKIINRKIWKHV